MDSDQLRTQVLETFRTHSSTCGREVGFIRTTDHLIPLEARKTTIDFMPYRTGLAVRDMFAKEVNELLNPGVSEPVGTNWASAVVLVPHEYCSHGSPHTFVRRFDHD